MSRATTVLRQPKVVGDPCPASDVEIGDKICDVDGIVRRVDRIERYDNEIVFCSVTDELECIVATPDQRLAVIKA